MPFASNANYRAKRVRRTLRVLRQEANRRAAKLPPPSAAKDKVPELTPPPDCKAVGPQSNLPSKSPGITREPSLPSSRKLSIPLAPTKLKSWFTSGEKGHNPLPHKAFQAAKQQGLTSSHDRFEEAVIQRFPFLRHLKGTKFRKVINLIHLTVKRIWYLALLHFKSVAAKDSFKRNRPHTRYFPDYWEMGPILCSALYNKAGIDSFFKRIVCAKPLNWGGTPQRLGQRTT